MSLDAWNILFVGWIGIILANIFFLSCTLAAAQILRLHPIKAKLGAVGGVGFYLGKLRLEIGWLQFNSFVKFDENYFDSKPSWRKALVALAGIIGIAIPALLVLGLDGTWGLMYDAFESFWNVMRDPLNDASVFYLQGYENVPVVQRLAHASALMTAFNVVPIIPMNGAVFIHQFLRTLGIPAGLFFENEKVVKVMLAIWLSIILFLIFSLVTSLLALQ